MIFLKHDGICYQKGNEGKKRGKVRKGPLVLGLGEEGPAFKVDGETWKSLTSA